MARRSQRATPREADATPPEGGLAAAGQIGKDSGEKQLLVFKIADALFGFRLTDVGEIIRLPGLAHMPLGPRSLLGLANLRGAVLPVIILRRLLALPDAPLDGATRVIVIEHGVSVGVVVDRIENLLTVRADQIEKEAAGAGSIDPEVLDGVIKGAELDSTIKILSPERLLRHEFAQLGVSGPRAVARVSISAAISAPAATQRQQQVALLSFDLQQQEYALPLDRVREIIPLPKRISEIPRSETAVLGVVTLRNRLLPLVSLRALLGLPCDLARKDHGKVVVLSMGDGAVGLVADRTREILHVDPGLIDPAPALLTRGAGDAEITSICRLEQGRRLVAILSPARLFRSDLVRRVLSELGNEHDDAEAEMDLNTMPDEQFIIFRLGHQEYGLPIAAVSEIARPPDRITRLPKAPAFIDGVVNLRGTVVPIIDLRRRFDLPSREPGRDQRILILAVGHGKTGFMVDGVSEVMKVPANAIRPAPSLSPEQMRLIGRVANLNAQSRMILLIDPAQLLDQVEAEVLSKLKDLEKASKAS